MTTGGVARDGSAAVRRLWLVRHGETEGQSSIRYHGSNDVPLSDVGRAQIRALAPLLRDVSFSRLVHSPLSRAVESAQLLALAIGHHEPLEVDERLREISFGTAEGMTREEIAARWPDFWSGYEAGRVDAFPGGEPRAGFAARVAAAIDELARAAAGDVLVVAHRGIVKHALLALLHPADFEAADDSSYGVELGSLSVVRAGPGAVGWQLEALSLLP